MSTRHRHALVLELLAALDEFPELAAELDAKLAATRGATTGRRYETYAQRAERMGIGRSTIRRAYTEGRLEILRVGKRVLIPVDAEIAPRSADALMRAEQHLGLVTRRCR